MPTLPLIHLEVALCIAHAVVLGLIDPAIHLVVHRDHAINPLVSVLRVDLFCWKLTTLIPLILLTQKLPTAI